MNRRVKRTIVTFFTRGEWSRAPTDARAQSRIRRGATLIELLVCLSIISLLLSLILPAVAESREAARKVACLNNLKQVSLACQSFHEAHRALPSQNFAVVSAAPNSGPPGAISVWGQLLPFLDQSVLHRRINFDESGSGSYLEPPTSMLNASLLKESVAALVCPSDEVRIGGTNYRVCLGTAPGPPHRERSGAFFSLGRKGRRATFEMIRDGLSQTVLCSEKIVGDLEPSVFSASQDTYFITNSPFSDPDIVRNWCSSYATNSTTPHASNGGATWLLNGYAFVWYNHVDVPNSPIPDCTNGGTILAQAKVTARSWHRGGVNCAMADASVRFVSESIDLRIWRAVGTRAGKEVATEW